MAADEIEIKRLIDAEAAYLKRADADADEANVRRAGLAEDSEVNDLHDGTRADQADALRCRANAQVSGGNFKPGSVFAKTHLDGKFVIEVIDLKKQPHLAREHAIVAIPTLVRQLPVPIRKIIGDLSDTQKVLVNLDVRGR